MYPSLQAGSPCFFSWMRQASQFPSTLLCSLVAFLGRKCPFLFPAMRFKCPDSSQRMNLLAPSTSFEFSTFPPVKITALLRFFFFFLLPTSSLECWYYASLRVNLPTASPFSPLLHFQPHCSRVDNARLKGLSVTYLSLL